MRQDELRVRPSNIYWKYGLPTVVIVVVITLGFVFFSKVIAWSIAGVFVSVSAVYGIKNIPPAIFNSLILFEKYKQERIATIKAKIDLHFVETKSGTYVIKSENRTIEIDSFYPAVPASKQLVDIPQLPSSTNANLLELIDAYPHVLIWGGSGNGKTSLLRTIAYQRKLRGHKVLILDSREHPAKWQGLDRLETPEKISQAIKVLFQILNKNVEALRTGQATEADFERITVVTDEWTEIVSENDTAKEFIATMVRQSRKYGIHLVFATQTNLAADLGLDGRYKTINGFLQLELKKKPDGTHIADAVVANQKLGEFVVPKPLPLPELLPTGYVSPSLDFDDQLEPEEPTEQEQQILDLYAQGMSLRAICREITGKENKEINGRHIDEIKEVLEKFGCDTVTGVTE